MDFTTLSQRRKCRDFCAFLDVSCALSHVTFESIHSGNVMRLYSNVGRDYHRECNLNDMQRETQNFRSAKTASIISLGP